MSKKVKRLFEQFQPSSYKLSLIPDKEHMIFSGSVVIKGQKTGPPNQRITLHQKNLVITKAKLIRHDKKGDQEIVVDRLNTHKSFDELRLHSKQMIYPGQFSVKIEFNGKITRPMDSIYPCFFKLKGTKKTLIATQFESHHARGVFPCIDEPEAKATFDLELITPTGEAVISNTPIKKQKTRNKKQVTIFETTPVMPTYLLAFVYGELKYASAKTKHGVDVRVYATPDNVRLTDFALKTAVKCLEFYEDYFGIKYPLAKCDLIALPDFASAAMENWGCITFRDQALLVDEKNTSLASKQMVALVIAHELAHQWFGNLVTMRWWTDLWLNEGFASWISYLAVDKLFPDWQMWTQFMIDEQQQALKLDALEYTHPVEVPINHPDEIRTIFDTISYSKGSSIIHMLYNFLSEDTFRGGLSHYLNKYSYKNTDTTDLWAALEEISGKKVKDFMHAWTSQPGFPFVNAQINENAVSLTQQRFFISPKHKNRPSTNWPVPLLSTSKNLGSIMLAKSEEHQVSNSGDLKLNSLQSGFYRVAYNASHLELLGKRLKTGHLDAKDRLGLLSDVFESSKAGLFDTVEALHFLDYFLGEDDYAVWSVIASGVGSIKLAMDDDELRELIKPFVRSLVSKQLARLGWNKKDKEPHFDSLLRPIILSLAASADEGKIVKKCFALFNKIQHAEDVSPDLQASFLSSNLKRSNGIDPDLRGTVFGTIARLGGEKDFTKLLKLHNTVLLSEERITLSAALTGFKQPEIIDRSLKLITTDTVRLQDVFYWIVYSFLNRHAKIKTWEWLKANWTWLEKNLGSDLGFSNLPAYAARSFSDEKFLKQYEKFFQSVMSPSLKRSFDQGKEIIQWQSAWKQRDLKEVINFFKAQ